MAESNQEERGNQAPRTIIEHGYGYGYGYGTSTHHHQPLGITDPSAFIGGADKFQPQQHQDGPPGGNNGYHCQKDDHHRRTNESTMAGEGGQEKKGLMEKIEEKLPELNRHDYT